MNDLAGRLNETPDAFSFFLYMVKDTRNILHSQLISLVKFPENVSCSINATNCCGLKTLAASYRNYELFKPGASRPVVGACLVS